MNGREKREKKATISESINLANGRYKDYEVDRLYDLATRRDEYNGTTRTYRSSYDGWCSDGKYTRFTEETYSFVSDEKGVRIEYDSRYRDDDGASGGYRETYDTGRSILSAFNKLFG